MPCVDRDIVHKGERAQIANAFEPLELRSSTLVKGQSGSGEDDLTAKRGVRESQLLRHLLLAVEGLVQNRRHECRKLSCRLFLNALEAVGLPLYSLKLISDVLL